MPRDILHCYKMIQLENRIGRCTWTSVALPVQLARSFFGPLLVGSHRKRKGHPAISYEMGPYFEKALSVGQISS